jgi:hypothetical protein
VAHKVNQPRRNTEQTLGARDVDGLREASYAIDARHGA